MSAADDQVAVASALAGETALGSTLRTVRHLSALVRDWTPAPGMHAHLVLAQATQQTLGTTADSTGWLAAGTRLDSCVVVAGDHRSLLEQRHIGATADAVAMAAYASLRA